MECDVYVVDVFHLLCVEVELFGSSRSLACSNSSDVDLVLFSAVELDIVEIGNALGNKKCVGYDPFKPFMSGLFFNMCC
jgi:hypothetical protein